MCVQFGENKHPTGLLCLTTDKETRIPFCAVPVAFGFAHLTDEGGEYESKERRAYMYSRAWRYQKLNVTETCKEFLSKKSLGSEILIRLLAVIQFGGL